MAICREAQCERSTYAKGLCAKHYKQLWASQRKEDVPCAVDGCGNLRHRQDLCNAHYQRALKYGDPLGAPPARPSAEDRFWAKVDASGPCWEWTAGRNKNYGVFHYNGRDVKAHRFAYELLVAPIPEGMEIDHLCRNPPCVNPDHLEPVERTTNVRRGALPKIRAAKTHCPQGHPYDEANTYRSPKRPNQRTCKTCTRKASLNGYYRRQAAAAEKNP